MAPRIGESSGDAVEFEIKKACRANETMRKKTRGQVVFMPENIPAQNASLRVTNAKNEKAKRKIRQEQQEGRADWNGWRSREG